MKNLSGTIKAGIVIVSFLLLSGCSGILDGPFSGGMGGGLAFANNNSDFVTYWDDKTNSYRTYDQWNNVHLEKAVFSVAEAKAEAEPNQLVGWDIGNRLEPYNSQPNHYSAIGRDVMVPLTTINKEKFSVQKQQECAACLLSGRCNTNGQTQLVTSIQGSFPGPDTQVPCVSN